MPGQLINLDGVTKAFPLEGGPRDGFRDRTILKRVSLLSCRDHFLGIVGPSGSGKSTLLNILGCLERPTSGHYRFDGIEVTALDERRRSALRREKIGFIFQNHQLLPRLTLLENVALPLAYRRVPRAAREARAREALARVDLADRAEARPRLLSGGEQQRGAIARALVHRPQLLLADEPTGALDEIGSRAMLELLRELAGPDHGVIMVTHDAALARRYVDRMLTLSNGTLANDLTLARGDRVLPHGSAPPRARILPRPLRAPLVSGGLPQDFAQGLGEEAALVGPADRDPNATVLGRHPRHPNENAPVFHPLEDLPRPGTAVGPGPGWLLPD